MSLDDGWLPGWQHLPSQVKEGEYYVGGHPARVTWHTTEGWVTPGSAQGHRAPPQLWPSPRTRLKVQTIPLVWAGYACWDQRDYPVRTNTVTNNVQVEVEGFAGQTQTWPAEWLDWLGDEVLVPIMQFYRHHGIPFDPMSGPDIANEQMSGSSYEDAPQRFGWQDWANFNSQCGHRHVPGNGERWDPGPLDVKHIGRRAVAVLGGSFTPAGTITPPSEEEDLTPEQDRLLKAIAEVVRTDLAGRKRRRADGSEYDVLNLPELIDVLMEENLAGIDKVVRDGHNFGAWTWGKIKDADLAGGGGGGEVRVEKVLDVDASLAQATPAQLITALSKKPGFGAAA